MALGRIRILALAPSPRPSPPAGDAKDYQVTGPVLEVNASYIVVQKGDQKWQIAVDQSTKGDKPKVGDKVTIYYKMTATEIETKPVKK